MFLGQYEHTLDDGGRISLPAKYRAELAEGMVITCGLDRCLYLFPLKRWTPLAERISTLPLSDPDARVLRRLLFSGAGDVVPDRQGRILIPAYLREYANIRGRVVIVGLYDYIELWDAEDWHKMQAEVEKKGMSVEQWEKLGI